MKINHSFQISLKNDLNDIKLKKDSINSDGHQFHWYQQNEQSSLILTELISIKMKINHSFQISLKNDLWSFLTF
jgi:hypothetical protein